MDPASVFSVLVGQVLVIALVLLALFFVIRAAVVSALLRVGIGTRPRRAPRQRDSADQAERDAERRPGQ
ncbi:hypothetical protein [Rathayibacter sp. VKM Ac-2801]|uniref:hypothetical protein n=1 Tax=Rathayibacter sp. VKM Ac-2801 TaxID=2609255 RepID=UPI0013204B1D|nr:hypothetical protein [Rathayibacter sp. VKM Ac-2801]QHC69338.1 hypothetical protein GSU45_02350 [Rathayibacter sp. VKM Ac-2801]